jgi:hypothetical protein
MESGFVSGYPPPGEVYNVWFEDASTMHWNPERSVGTYHLYRDDTCSHPDLTDPLASIPDVPGVDTFYSYLVTAMNRISEEGTQGYKSDSSERTNADPCP